MAIEFELLGVSFQREASIQVYYKERLVGERRVDFLVEGKVTVELKALGHYITAILTKVLIIWRYIILRWDY